MKCDIKTMLKAGLWLAALVTGVYVVFPSSREWLMGGKPVFILAALPVDDVVHDEKHAILSYG